MRRSKRSLWLLGLAPWSAACAALLGFEELTEGGPADARSTDASSVDAPNEEAGPTPPSHCRLGQLPELPAPSTNEEVHFAFSSFRFAGAQNRTIDLDCHVTKVDDFGGSPCRLAETLVPPGRDVVVDDENGGDNVLGRILALTKPAGVDSSTLSGAYGRGDAGIALTLRAANLAVASRGYVEAWPAFHFRREEGNKQCYAWTPQGEQESRPLSFDDRWCRTSDAQEGQVWVEPIDATHTRIRMSFDRFVAPLWRAPEYRRDPGVSISYMQLRGVYIDAQAEQVDGNWRLHGELAGAVVLRDLFQQLSDLQTCGGTSEIKLTDYVEPFCEVRDLAVGESGTCDALSLSVLFEAYRVEGHRTHEDAVRDYAACVRSTPACERAPVPDCERGTRPDERDDAGVCSDDGGIEPDASDDGSVGEGP